MIYPPKTIAIAIALPVVAAELAALITSVKSAAVGRNSNRSLVL
jgi:hypothetical protein